MSSRTLTIAVLSTLLVAGLALSLIAAWRSDDWWGFALNFGTELVGAVVVYYLLDQFIGRRERTESERAKLIAELGSSVQDVAVAAAEKLGQNGWLVDGSLQWASLESADLQGASLGSADLQRANLIGASLQGARLVRANLQEARLVRANLQGANLWSADLRGADLRGADLIWASLLSAKLDGNTALPDGTTWTPDTDLARFTDVGHPDFWLLERLS
jgi:uncharacterized protein YjbI with pentapeptide repeats